MTISISSPSDLSGAISSLLSEKTGAQIHLSNLTTASLSNCDLFKTIGSFLGDVASKIMEGIQAAMTALIELLSGFINMIDKIVRLLQPYINMALEAFMAVAGLIGNLLNAVFSVLTAIATAVAQALQALVGIADGLLSSILDLVGLNCAPVKGAIVAAGLGVGIDSLNKTMSSSTDSDAMKLSAQTNISPALNSAHLTMTNNNVGLTTSISNISSLMQGL